MTYYTYLRVWCVAFSSRAKPESSGGVSTREDAIDAARLNYPAMSKWGCGESRTRLYTKAVETAEAMK